MITEGSVNPHDILAIKGTDAVQNYLIQEVQRVYRMQGVDINDKHIEVIVRQMMKKVRVDDEGDTLLMPNSLVEKSEFDTANEEIRARIAAGELDLREATCTPTLLGITKRLWLPIRSCQPPLSRRPPECSPTPLSRVRLTRCWA